MQEKSLSSFRSFHLLEILESYEEQNCPLDVFVSRYFRKHRSIGSKDRRVIADTLYAIIRWKGLLDSLTSDPPSWKRRLKIYCKVNPFDFQKKDNLSLSARLSFPKWIITKLLSGYNKEKTIAFCLSSNRKAPITIRVNTNKISRTTLLHKWREKMNAFPCSQSSLGITFRSPIHLLSLPEFRAGFFEIQDEGSQLVANNVLPKKGDHILDYCAGSGGKTLAFAPKTEGKGQIYLSDIRPHILHQAKKRLKRAGVQNAQIVTKKELKKNRFQKRMDWILLDVPCSGSGTFRRNPTMKWSLLEQDIAQFVATQRAIFLEVLPLLKPKGKIVYATCSVFPEENEQQIDYFLQNHPFTLLSAPFSSFPQDDGMDGFFCATLQHKVPLTTS